MKPLLPGALLAAALVLLATAPARAGDVTGKRARLDYILHCSGCHDMDGSGHPGKGIPSFPGQIGYFAALPEGRAMLMQVPGLLNSGLNDERAAAVTTWLVRQFAGTSLPADFTDYTAEEARRYRASRPADINGVRERLYRQIVESGYVVERGVIE